MLFLSAPSLSGLHHPHADTFLDAVEECLTVEVPERVHRVGALLARVQRDDGVVFFNPTQPHESSRLGETLCELEKRGAHLFPVALDKASQCPPEQVAHLNAFDVHDHMVGRGLQPDQVRVVGRAFAWKVLSTWKPTYASSNIQLFLSYGRSDTGDLVREVEGALLRCGHRPLRDLGSSLPGVRWRDQLHEHIERSDVVVFFDSPRARQSDVVKWELTTALTLNVPVVWLGFPAGNVDLPVWPGPGPEKSFESTDFDEAALGELADFILERAVAKRMSRVRAAEICLTRLDEVVRSSGEPIRHLDRRQHIYRVSAPCRSGPYPSRPHTHIVQLFGRQPSHADRAHLAKWLEGHPDGPDGMPIGEVDALITLAPGPISMASEGGAVTEYGTRYVETVAAASSQSARFRAPDRPNLLLFGAFPRATGSHQTVIDAVHEVTTTWLSRGGAVTFGGHPTFTPLVLGVARTQAPSIDREQVTIYQSLARASGADREALNERAVAVFTEDLGDDAASLTLMRSRMVDESGAVAAVAIGGRTDEGGTHAPGTQEEVDLARGRSVPIPVFLLAATGGHTAVMAAEAAQTEPPWAALGNPLTADGNAQLAGSDDFWAIARQIWDLTVGSP